MAPFCTYLVLLQALLLMPLARLTVPKRLFFPSHLTDGTVVPEAPIKTPHTHLTASGELREGGRKPAGAGVPRTDRLGWAEVGRRRREG